MLKVKPLFIYRTNGKVLRGDQVCRTKWQDFLLHHRWKWFAVIPHLEDPPHCGCPNPSVPTQNIQACVHCVVMGTRAYPWTPFRWSLTITYLHREKLSFHQKSWIGAHTPLGFSAEACLLKCSNMEPNVSIAAAFELRGKGCFFPQRRRLLQ